MPGYKPLPSAINGETAEQVRLAEASDSDRAIELLEQAVESARSRGEPLPHYLCGRLAQLYRTLERFDDEATVLEAFRDSQTDERERSRYDARLSKAHALADRTRRTDNGALASIRNLRKPRGRASGDDDARAAP